MIIRLGSVPTKAQTKPTPLQLGMCWNPPALSLFFLQRLVYCKCISNDFIFYPKKKKNQSMESIIDEWVQINLCMIKDGFQKQQLYYRKYLSK